MISRFLQSEPGKRIVQDPTGFEKFMINEYERYNYKYTEKNNEEYDLDKIIGKQIMSHLEDFFKTENNNTTNNKTKRTKRNTKSKTFRRK